MRTWSTNDCNPPGPPCILPGEVIVVADPNLESAIRAELGIATEDLRVEDNDSVAWMTVLDGCLVDCL